MRNICVERNDDDIVSSRSSSNSKYIRETLEEFEFHVILIMIRENKRVIIRKINLMGGF